MDCTWVSQTEKGAGMTDIENEITNRLHRAAEAVAVRSDLEGVKSGRAATAGGIATVDPKQDRRRLAFVAAAAAIILGGWAVLSNIENQTQEVASEAASESTDVERPPSSFAPSAEELSADALAAALPTFYLESDRFQPVALSINRLPPDDITGLRWELKSSYQNIGEGPPSGVNLSAVPLETTSVEAQLASLGFEGEATASIGGGEGWIFESGDGETFAVFEATNHVVVLAFRGEVSDASIDLVLGSVADDLTGFQRVVADDALDEWVLAAISDPSPELEALFPRADSAESRQEPTLEQAADVVGADLLLQESDLLGGEFEYTFGGPMVLLPDPAAAEDLADGSDGTGSARLAQLITAAQSE